MKKSAKQYGRLMVKSQWSVHIFFVIIHFILSKESLISTF